MDIRRKGFIIAATALFICSTVFFTGAKPSLALSEMMLDEKTLGEICIGHMAPAARINGQEDKEEKVQTAEKERTAENAEADDKKEASDEEITVSGEPLVIIYHTHSSESYMPYKESNYHREEEEGTVRDVGAVLEAQLKKKGINVIHDKTVHDRPSYNESYSRSLATIQSLVKQYPSAVYIIDLHRDAAPASATEGKYTEIDGKRVATFSLVVGKANENYVELYDFAKKVTSAAGSMYEGFGGAIIEKNYNYNEFVSNKALLLEVGNNKNTIEEARECGMYFADVLASIIKEEQ
ncbi:MAG: stage II sporulation protein P [Anaerovoracaceae bacterium]|nr:stage II sporulation protein P [Anaerovoracaceae bacterium]